MQFDSRNEQLNTLCLSFKFYKALSSTLADSIRTKVNDEYIANTVRKSELLLNFLTVRNFFYYHKYLTNYYHSPIEINWSEHFSYFDLLDALIIQTYTKDEWTKCREALVSYGSNPELYNSFMMDYSAEKLKKLSYRIILELYKEQHGLNPYANQDLQFLQETTFINEDLAYGYFLSYQEKDVIEDYIDLESKCQDLKSSAEFYFNAAIKQTQLLLDQYGNAIENHLGCIWQSAYAERIHCLKKVKKAQAAVQREGLLNEVYFNDYFLLTEFLAYWWQAPELNEKELYLSSPEHADRLLSTIDTGDDTQLEQNIRQLYCYLLQVEHTSLEFLQFRYYALTGRRAKLTDFSINSALEISGARFS